jgi:hypothetical protein
MTAVRQLAPSKASFYAVTCEASQHVTISRAFAEEPMESVVTNQRL